MPALSTAAVIAPTSGSGLLRADRPDWTIPACRRLRLLDIRLRDCRLRTPHRRRCTTLNRAVDDVPVHPQQAECFLAGSGDLVYRLGHQPGRRARVPAPVSNNLARYPSPSRPLRGRSERPAVDVATSRHIKPMRAAAGVDDLTDISSVADRLRPSLREHLVLLGFAQAGEELPGSVRMSSAVSSREGMCRQLHCGCRRKPALYG